jgi:hypothetical protein
MSVLVSLIHEELNIAHPSDDTCRLCAWWSCELLSLYFSSFTLFIVQDGDDDFSIS